jgi:hypothetical protein
LDIKIRGDNNSKDSEDECIVIAIDSTGIKVTNRGQWVQDKWNEKVFENTYSSKRQDQGNYVNKGLLMSMFMIAKCYQDWLKIL